MKIKSVYRISNNELTSWALDGKSELCLSIINQTTAGKDPKIYYNFFVIDKLTESEICALSSAFSNNRDFNNSKDTELNIFNKGYVICDDDNNILNPDEFAGLLENQHNLYLMSLPWPSEDDDEMISSETEVGVLCQNSNVENVDL